MFLLWLVVLSLLLSLDEIDVRFDLLADNIWEAEDYKTGFLNVGVGGLDQIFFLNDQFPCPWCKIVLKIENMINEDTW